MSLESKRFTKNDAGFVCVHCGQTVEPLGYTSRNHCPFCLWSRHVDVLPGDRANSCGGAMEPIRVEPDRRRGYVIVHRCTVCGRTDVSNPELEFRYCSRCQGYHCYCIDHIGDHVHKT